MKLARVYRRYSLLVLTVVLVLGCISQYCIYSYSIHRTTDDVLREYRRDIEEFAAENDTLSLLGNIELKHSYLRRASRDAVRPRVRQTIYDSLIYSAYEQEPIVYRVLNFPVSTARRDYIVTLTLPTLEQHELVLAVIVSSVGLFLLFAGASLYAPRYMRRTMGPLYRILARMRSYDIREREPERPEVTDIDEFNELNAGLHQMMSRMRHDYKALKELMENASHELQTPLSVAAMKLEQLQQLCMHDERQMQYIAAVQDSLRRVSRFNRSMMLIARISSDQFYRREAVSLTALAKCFLEDHGEFVTAREVRVRWSASEEFVAHLHPMLAEMLVNNVLSNALKYNCRGGEIRIRTDAEMFCVENTYGNTIPEGDLFERYVRSEAYPQSTGLGLPIVREICIHNRLRAAAEATRSLFRLAISRDEP